MAPYRLLIMVAGLTLALRAQAITWNFDGTDNAQGWIAREGAFAGDGSIEQALHSEVRDGIWRIQVPPFQKERNPDVLLLSPIIGHDSALFDRMIIRFRVVHTQPIAGGEFTLRWTNPANLSYPGGDPSNDTICANPNCLPRFWLATTPVYTTDWQEITMADLRSRTAVWPGGDEYEILWEGKLTEIRLAFELWDTENHDGDNPYVGLDEVPEAVEIDWIKLTGVEEQLQGELPPPPTPADIPSGSLFAAPVFYPLGVKEVGSVFDSRYTGALGDLDGDGDLDLVAPWSDKKDHGWLLAFNDGKGGFTRTQVEHLSLSDGNSPFVGGADLDGNGRMDLVLWPGTGKPLQLWLNDPQEGWKITEVPDFYPLQVIDLDKDGDLDIWGWEGFPSASLFISRFLINGGKGNFSAPIRVEPPAEGYYSRDTIYPTTPEKRASLEWIKTPKLIIAYQTASGEVMQESLPILSTLVLSTLDWLRIVQIGDFDLDGHTDLMSSDRIGKSDDDILPTFGLNVLHNRGDGQMDTVSTFPDLKYTLKVQVTDVNRDGIVDVVVAHKDLRAPAVVVLLGQGDGRLVEEGRYSLPEGKGGPTLSGDLDNDGDVDLVVFDSYVAGGGGVHVLLSRLANQVTAVEEGETATPSQSHLGAAYPNPFNPGVVIPFTIGPAAAQVSLTVYNTLGQEVRKLELRGLPAGTHQVAWDGRDGKGKELSSGVYPYRLQAGTWSATGKMVKSR